jgi:hypothetical protein
MPASARNRYLNDRRGDCARRNGSLSWYHQLDAKILQVTLTSSGGQKNACNEPRSQQGDLLDDWGNRQRWAVTATIETSYRGS